MRWTGQEKMAPHEILPACEVAIADLRFCALLGLNNWLRLPAPIRARFSRRLGNGCTAVYVGEIVESRMSSAGWLLAQAARLIGGPFPTCCAVRMASVVSVTEDIASGAQNWTRLYARPSGFPQIIHSAKRFTGPTGLEEYVGAGISMALTVHIDGSALVFRSWRYFLQFGRLRLALPRWLTPGTITVTHAEAHDDRFSFTLDVVHPLFGALIHQSALFREVTP
jgi:hypothetical protein